MHARSRLKNNIGAEGARVLTISEYLNLMNYYLLQHNPTQLTTLAFFARSTENNISYAGYGAVQNTRFI